MERAIILADCDSFYASAEVMMDKGLRGLPVAVAGNPENRHGIIVSRNALAGKFGVRTTDSVYSAKKKCPELICVPPRHDKYEEISEQVNKIYLDYSDLVEPYSIDESYIDITGTEKLRSSSLRTVADEIRERVKREIGITVSLGCSFTRSFAKLASEMRKPDGTMVIAREQMEEIIHPLPVRELLYVGKSSAEALGKLGIKTIGDVAACDRELLGRKLGKNGDRLWLQATGNETDPVRSFYEPRQIKSVGNGFTFRRDIRGEEELRIGVSVMADSVAARLRKKGLKCRTVQIQIKTPNFSTISRQKATEKPTWLLKEITECAMELIRANWRLSDPVRALTVTCTDLVAVDEAAEQISFFDDPEENKRREKQERLEAAVARIRDRHGSGSISYGYTDSEDMGISRGRRKR